MGKYLYTKKPIQTKFKYESLFFNTVNNPLLEPVRSGVLLGQGTSSFSLDLSLL